MGPGPEADCVQLTRLAGQAVFRNRLFLEWVGALVFGCLLAWWASYSAIGGRLDFQLLDIATSLVADDPNSDIVIVTLDDRSLSREGSWPWPREKQARLIDGIAAAKPRAIIYDILLLEPSTPAADARLADSIERAGNVLLPHSFVAAREALSGIEPVMPLDKFASSAAAIGHVALNFEEDGAVRRIELVKSAVDGNHDHLTIAAYRLLNGHSPPALDDLAGDLRPIVPLRKVHGYPGIQAASILAGETPEAFLAGKIVFVGATAQGLGDTYAVSTLAGSAMSGVEIQANLFDNLGSGTFVRQVNGPVATAVSILAVVLLFLGFRVLRPNQLLGYAVVLAVLIIGSALLLPGIAGLWFPPTAAVAAIGISYPLWGWRRLASVVDFLSRESSNLRNIGETGRVEAAGFDEVDRQTNRLGSLVSLVQDRFQFIRAIIRNIPDPIVVFDRDGLSVLFNEQAQHVFGESEQGLTFQDLIIASKGSIDPKTGELAIGEDRTFAIARVPLELGSGDAPGEIVQFHEMTAIRSAERERRQMLEFLSHDMRSPQTAIIGMASEKSTGSSENERFASIRQQAERTLKLADDFVQIARMAETPLRSEDFDLAGLAEEAADRAHYDARKRGVELVRAMPEEPAFVRGDPSLVARIIDNLLSNALKFSPEESEIALKVAVLDGNQPRVRLEIADQGPGLPPERAANPFERFGHRDETRGTSSGLGLAFVAEAARKHSANLEVESRPGQGTRFRLDFPAA